MIHKKKKIALKKLFFSCKKYCLIYSRMNIVFFCRNNLYKNYTQGKLKIDVAIKLGNKNDWC